MVLLHRESDLSEVETMTLNFLEHKAIALKDKVMLIDDRLQLIEDQFTRNEVALDKMIKNQSSGFSEMFHMMRGLLNSLNHLKSPTPMESFPSPDLAEQGTSPLEHSENDEISEDVVMDDDSDAEICISEHELISSLEMDTYSKPPSEWEPLLELSSLLRRKPATPQLDITTDTEHSIVADLLPLDMEASELTVDDIYLSIEYHHTQDPGPDSKLSSYVASKQPISHQTPEFLTEVLSSDPLLSTLHDDVEYVTGDDYAESGNVSLSSFVDSAVDLSTAGVCENAPKTVFVFAGIECHSIGSPNNICRCHDFQRVWLWFKKPPSWPPDIVRYYAPKSIQDGRLISYCIDMGHVDRKSEKLSIYVEVLWRAASSFDSSYELRDVDIMLDWLSRQPALTPESELTGNHVGIQSNIITHVEMMLVVIIVISNRLFIAHIRQDLRRINELLSYEYRCLMMEETNKKFQDIMWVMGFCRSTWLLLKVVGLEQSCRLVHRVMGCQRIDHHLLFNLSSTLPSLVLVSVSFTEMQEIDGAYLQRSATTVNEENDMVVASLSSNSYLYLMIKEVDFQDKIMKRDDHLKDNSHALVLGSTDISTACFNDLHIVNYLMSKWFSLGYEHVFEKLQVVEILRWEMILNLVVDTSWCKDMKTFIVEEQEARVTMVIELVSKKCKGLLMDIFMQNGLFGHCIQRHSMYHWQKVGIDGSHFLSHDYIPATRSIITIIDVCTSHGSRDKEGSQCRHFSTSNSRATTLSTSHGLKLESDVDNSKAASASDLDSKTDTFWYNTLLYFIQVKCVIICFSGNIMAVICKEETAGSAQRILVIDGQEEFQGIGELKNKISCSFFTPDEFSLKTLGIEWKKAIKTCEKLSIAFKLESYAAEIDWTVQIQMACVHLMKLGFGTRYGYKSEVSVFQINVNIANVRASAVAVVRVANYIWDTQTRHWLEWFSNSRPPELMDLEDKVNFKGVGMMRIKYKYGLGFK